MKNLKTRKIIFALAFAGLGIIIPTGCQSTSNNKISKKQFRFEVKQPSFPDRTYNIKEFGAVNNGTTLNTEAFASAIEQCHQEGGGKVLIPEGIWLTGPIELKSNVNLHISEGAVVLFAEDFDLYPYIETSFEGKPDLRAKPLIYAKDCKNIAITGKGIFDGSGEAWRPVKKFKMTDRNWNELLESGGVLNEEEDIWWPNQYAYEASKNPEKIVKSNMSEEKKNKYKAFFRPPLMQLVDCEIIELNGPTFQNSPGWCLHPLKSNHLTVNNITVRNPWYAQNGDGIDIESCKYVRILNSQFDVGDDAMCMKSGKNEAGRERGMPTEYVEIKNNIVHHGHGGFVIGSEMSGGVKNIWVENCTFTGTDVGLRFKSTRGRGGVVSDIHIKNIRMIDIERDAIIFNLFYAGQAPTEADFTAKSYIESAPEASIETPEFKNISMENIICNGAYRAVFIQGLPEMPVNGLSIKNSVITAKEGINCTFVNELELKYVTINTRNTPAIKLINATGATASGINSNRDTFFHVKGIGTKNILLQSKQPEKIKNKIITGEEINQEELKIEKL